MQNDQRALVRTDLWILQAAFPTVTSCLFPVSRKAPLMVSMVFPDLGPNVGNISWITGFWTQRQNRTLYKLCATFQYRFDLWVSGSYHKGEALHLGYLMARYDLHCVSWGGEVPTEHWGALHFSPPKQDTPPPTAATHTEDTQTNHYPLPQPPSVYPNLIIIYYSAGMHKEAIFLWDWGGCVFVFS